MLFVAILTVTLLFFSTLLYQMFVKAQQREFDADLINYAVDISNAIDFDLFGDLSLDPGVVYEEQKVFPFSLGTALFQIRREDGSTVARSKSLLKNSLPLTRNDFKLAHEQGKIIKDLFLPAPGDHIVSYRLINYVIQKQFYPTMVLQVAVPQTFIESQRNNLITFFVIAIPAIILVSALGGYLFARRALAPVNQVIDNTNAINAESLSDRIPVPPVRDEIGRLAETINGLLTRLQSAFESQERFIADASHQLKTPLAVLRGELDVLMSRDRSKEEVAAFMKSASQEISMLSKMVEDLLLLARVDAGTSALVLSEMRLDEVVLAEIPRLEKVARTKNIKLGVDFVGFEEQSAPTVKGDRYLLSTMVYNLIENAIKYSRPDEIVKVVVENTPSDVLVRVIDTGEGIDPEKIPQIFDRFFRATQDAKTSGMGLGLSIVKKIASLHNATIHVTSELDRGSTFTVQIKKN